MLFQTSAIVIDNKRIKAYGFVQSENKKKLKEKITANSVSVNWPIRENKGVR